MAANSHPPLPDAGRLDTSYEHLQGILSTLGICLYEFTESSFRFVGRRISGHDPDILLREPDHWLGVIHPDEREFARAASEESIRSGTPYSVEVRVQHADGRTVWARDVAKPTGETTDGETIWVGFAMDVTALREAERKVREASRHFEFAQAIAPAISARLDRSGVAEHFAGDEWFVLRVREGEIFVDRLRLAVHPTDVRTADGLRAAMEAPDPQPVSVMFRLKDHRGTWRWILWITAVLPDPLGAEPKWYGYGVDVTEDKVLTDELKDISIRLSPRRFEVFLLLAKGLTNGELAKILHLSERTVEGHVASILQILAMGNRAAAAALSTRLAEGSERLRSLIAHSGQTRDF
jgi:PAS domain S-box-containing protein